jgi:altronate hydrolase
MRASCGARVVDLVDDPDVHLIGFPGCYPNDYKRIMAAVGTHPNVGGVVLVSLGCEVLTGPGWPRRCGPVAARARWW